MSFIPQLHNDTFWGEIKSNLNYFIPSRRKDFVVERGQLWEKHINTYIKIKYGKDSTAKDWGASRIELLNFSLDVLDRKFSSILQFQGLLAIAMSVGLATLRGIIHFGPPILLGMGVFVLLWFVIIFMSMRAVGRMFWGDLWRETCPAKAEGSHVAMLIQCVIRRTSRFRVTIFLALTNGLILVLIFLTALWNG